MYYFQLIIHKSVWRWFLISLLQKLYFIQWSWSNLNFCWTWDWNDNSPSSSPSLAGWFQIDSFSLFYLLSLPFWTWLQLAFFLWQKYFRFLASFWYISQVSVMLLSCSIHIGISHPRNVDFLLSRASLTLPYLTFHRSVGVPVSCNNKRRMVFSLSEYFYCSVISHS